MAHQKIEVPSDIKPEDIAPESQLVNPSVDKIVPKHIENNPVNKPATIPPTKLPDTKLQTQPANKPPVMLLPKPKAVMPQKPTA